MRLLYQTHLKTALISPLFKKTNSNTEDLNFCPISNLPFISKLIEISVAAQLLQHIDDNILGGIKQSACKKLHSFETALLGVQDDILRYVDRSSTVLLLLDLSEAFDSLDHGLLIRSRISLTEVNLLAYKRIKFLVILINYLP